MELHLERITLADSVHVVLSTVEPLARTKDITLEHDSDAGLQLTADPIKPTDALEPRLQRNRFTPSGGRWRSGLARPARGSRSP